MFKNTLVILSFLCLALGGCQSQCEEGADIAVECGDITESQRAGAVDACEQFGGNTADSTCLDCVSSAADPCTADRAGGPCESACD